MSNVTILLQIRKNPFAKADGAKADGAYSVKSIVIWLILLKQITQCIAYRSLQISKVTQARQNS